MDVNSAFLSWEATKRVAEGLPDLRLIPSAIGGDPQSRTSIIAAKSIPAKKYGITTGEAVSSAIRKCPDLVVVRSDFELYRRCSKAFISICRDFTPTIQQFSIDECFMDMTGMENFYPDPVQTAHELKDRIYRELGFTVNVGVGPNKLLAKMASDFEKPDKVHTLWMEEIPAKMWPLPVGELFMVGRQSAEKLKKNYVRTIGELAARSEQSLKMLLGDKAGEYAYRASHGIDDSPVSDEWEDEKSFSHSVTLEQDVRNSTDAKNILLSIADHVGRRIRRDGARAYCVGVTIRDNNFKDRSHQKKLSVATDISTDIYRTACQLFDELWDGHTPLRLLNITLSEVTRDEVQQMSLIPGEDEKREKSRKADRAVDAILEKYGSGAIKRASQQNNE